MTIAEKAKEKLDEASQELKAAVDGLAEEVAELSGRVKEKLKGSGEEMKEVAEVLSKEVKELSEKVKQLIPKRRQREHLPVRRVVKSKEYYPEGADFPFAEFRRELNRLVDDFFRRFEFPPDMQRGYWFPSRGVAGTLWPQVDVCETGDNVLIRAELPGIDKDDIEVSIYRDRIVIRGEKKSEEERTGYGFHHIERYHGAFYRSLSLPWEVDSERADATFKDGVLTVSMPKSAEAIKRTKKISVVSD
ncbi:MAG: Hsp20 family protein [Deltaproteobacteria bacterium]|nr:Hsp20 family protein [Deltaproteobacteria bacterium]MBW1961368.1 Hsp20 family protein [Deltaproteobacteria bacterium]MBW1993307.1 Hsp20 family protein [Deltaproteobacteria bacterium]MBW2152528.1 Hsp20 family protein [Deltaproteobacteria bacterium]